MAGTITIIGIADQVEIAEDGSFANFELLVLNGSPLAVTVGTYELASLVAFLSHISTEAQTRRREASAPDLDTIDAILVARLGARPAEDGSAVALQIHARNGTPYTFAISPDQSASLRKQMEESEKLAWATARQTRQ